MLNLHGISRESFDLIVNEEVSGREVYEAKYVHPEKPGGQSGVTIGIGYDCGYYTAAAIRHDWEGKIPHTMVEALATQAAGIKGDAAFGPCQRLKGLVTVPWDAAIDVFSNVSVPKYMVATRNALPGYDDLPPDCKGVLLSLVYNRGASFSLAGDRYSEMRAIREAMVAKNWGAIPGLLRKMKRLWTSKSVRGVAIRREHEAALFERGLASIGHSTGDVPVGDDEDGDATGPYPSDDAIQNEPARLDTPAAQPINVQPQRGEYSLDIEILQRKIDRLGYHEVGDPDGKWGGKTKGALTAFLNDRGSDIVVNGGPTPAINDAISKALAEGWSRPIAEKRATATAAQIAPKVEAVRQTLWQRLGAKITGAFGLGAAAVSGASDNFAAVNDKISPIKEFFTATPGWVWFVLVAMGAVIVYLSADKAQKATVQDYNTGKIN